MVAKGEARKKLSRAALPRDLKILTAHLNKELIAANIQPTPEKHRRNVNLALARLLIYNKRRSGELEAAR